MIASTTRRHATSEDDIIACFDVMRELRPHLENPRTFAAQIIRQQTDGYQLLALWNNTRPVALAGYRVQENLLHGRHLFVDDLVTSESVCGHGLGARLLTELKTEAVKNQCARLALGTAIGNDAAQRFYHRAGLVTTGLGLMIILKT